MGADGVRVTDAERYPCDKEGWIQKEGGAVKTWKRRWAIMRGKNIWYFKYKGDNWCKGSILLEKTSVVALKKDTVFTISTPKRVFVLYCDKAHEVKSWMEAIQKNIAILNGAVFVQPVGVVPMIVPAAAIGQQHQLQYPPQLQQQQQPPYPQQQQYQYPPQQQQQQQYPQQPPQQQYPPQQQQPYPQQPYPQQQQQYQQFSQYNQPYQPPQQPTAPPSPQTQPSLGKQVSHVDLQKPMTPPSQNIPIDEGSSAPTPMPQYNSSISLTKNTPPSTPPPPSPSYGTLPRPNQQPTAPPPSGAGGMPSYPQISQQPPQQQYQPQMYPPMGPPPQQQQSSPSYGTLSRPNQQPQMYPPMGPPPQPFGGVNYGAPMPGMVVGAPMVGAPMVVAPMTVVTNGRLAPPPGATFLNSPRGELIVRVISARNLVAADLNGFSDPYIKIRTPCSKKEPPKTRIIHKNLNPTWNETFTIPIDNVLQDMLIFEVWDHDNVGSDDLIGFVGIDLSLLPLGVEVVTYENLSYVQHGEIQIGLTATNFGIQQFTPMYPLDYINWRTSLCGVSKKGMKKEKHEVRHSAKHHKKPACAGGPYHSKSVHNNYAILNGFLKKKKTAGEKFASGAKTTGIIAGALLVGALGN